MLGKKIFGEEKHCPSSLGKDASTLLLFRRDKKGCTSIVLSIYSITQLFLLFPGQFLLCSYYTLWNYNSALSLCSLKQNFYLKLQLGYKRNIFFLNHKNLNFQLARQTTSLTSIHFLPSSVISAPCFYSARFSNIVMHSFINFHISLHRCGNN